MDAVSGMIELVKLVKNNWFIMEDVNTLERRVRRLTSRRADIQSELERIELSSNKKRKYSVANWLVDVDTTENKVRRLEVDMRESKLGWNVRWQSRIGNLIKEIDELNGITFGGGLVSESAISNRVHYTVPKLMGQAFQVIMTKIWEWITSDEVLSFGIYGMGGVGKTTLMMHIYNQLLDRPSNFNNIYWITVSQDFSIYKLQEKVAKEIKFDLSGEDDDKKRAAILREELIKRQRSVLILDDMWIHFDPDQIGLPINSRACKLILTTRSLDICWKMCCQQKMKLETLPEEESFSLFTETLGNYETLELEVKQVAKLVADECAGLPLGLVALAGSMRGVDDIREWRSVFEQLRNSMFGLPEVENKVFKVLKLSFDRLTDPEIQKVFLYCALFPEDFEIPRGKLIQYLVNDEIIKGPTSRKAKVDRVHTLLNKLENVGLLQGVPKHFECVKIHGLVRDMAIKNSSNAMVKPGKQLSELPRANSWPTDLEIASFIGNNIEHVPGDYSPLCNKLSSLLLSRNALRDIENCFFTHMLGLKILDLSETLISVLPDSVSNLVNLTSLLLRYCQKLHYIPSLATLWKLQELDFFGCFKLEQVPAGLEFLSNLMYLDLEDTGIKVLPFVLFSHNLSNLEHLGLPYRSSLNERLACSGKLDYLSCHVQSPLHFIGMVTDDVQRLSPSKYKLMIGEGIVDPRVLYNMADSKKVVLFYKCDIGEGGELFASPSTGFDIAYIQSCLSLTSLDKNQCVDDGRVACQRKIELVYCDRFECIISPTCVPVPSNIVNHVVKLTLRRLKNLRFLIHGAQPLLSSNVFSCLRVLEISDCPRIQSLFPIELMTNLRNLEKITVKDCHGIVELIRASGIEGAAAKPSLLLGEASNINSHHNNESAEFISLQKLKVFKLWNLPQLKSICSRKMSCASLEKVDLQGCRRLERIPFSLVQLVNGRPSPLPSLKEIKLLQREKEWWDSVEFDSQLTDTKYVLEPLIRRSVILSDSLTIKSSERKT